MKNTRTFYGKVEKGSLRLYRKDRLNQFCLDNEGKPVALTVKAIEGEGTENQRGYFRNVLVPVFQQAFHENGERYTQERTEELILSYCPASIRETVVNGKYVKHVAVLEELDKYELSEVIDTLKEIAAKEFSIFVE